MSAFTSFLQRLHNLVRPPVKAAESWRKLGGKENHTFWMFAHPIHLALNRDHFVLPEPAPLLAASDEAQIVIQSLNQHFLSQHLYFYLRENTWFVGLDENPKLQTSALMSALNRDVTPLLPQGEGALKWAKITNEIQMLLFNHPINVAREARGELPINSLWFDGLSQLES